MISTRMHAAFAKGISSGPSTKLVVQSHLQFQSKGMTLASVGTTHIHIIKKY